MSWPTQEQQEELQALRRQGLALQAQLSSSATAGESADHTALQARLDRLHQEIADQVLAPPPAPLPRPSHRLIAACMSLVLLFGAGGYAWKGQPEAISPEAAPDRTEAMVAGLARRLQQQPEDAAGWAMLGRSYLVLGRSEPSIAAYRRALALRPEDADLMADLADVMASGQQGSLEGEPAALLQRALQIAPDHLKALALSGTRALRQGDAAGAIRHWQRLQDIAPAEHPLRELAVQGLVAARAQGPRAPAAPPSTPAGAASARRP